MFDWFISDDPELHPHLMVVGFGAHYYTKFKEMNAFERANLSSPIGYHTGDAVMAATIRGNAIQKYRQ